MYYFGLILSIITVCYNAKEDLAQTVDSVLSQTWRNFEYIVVDGDSTDGTKEYLEQLRPLWQPVTGSCISMPVTSLSMHRFFVIFLRMILIHRFSMGILSAPIRDK